MAIARMVAVLSSDVDADYDDIPVDDGFGESTLQAEPDESAVQETIEAINKIDVEITEGLRYMTILEDQAEVIEEEMEDETEDDKSQAVAESLGVMYTVCTLMGNNRNDVKRITYFKMATESIHTNSKEGLRSILLGFKSVMNKVIEKVMIAVDKVVMFFSKASAQMSEYFNKSKEQVTAMQKKFKDIIPPDPSNKDHANIEKIDESFDEDYMRLVFALAIADPSKKSLVTQVENYTKANVFIPNGYFKNNTTSISAVNILKKFADRLKSAESKNKALDKQSKFFSLLSQDGMKVESDVTFAEFINSGNKNSENKGIEIHADDEKLKAGSSVVYLGSNGSELNFLIVKLDEDNNCEFDFASINIVYSEINRSSFKDTYITQDMISSIREALATSLKFANNQKSLIDNTFKALSDCRVALRKIKTQLANEELTNEMKNTIRAVSKLCTTISRNTLKQPQDYIKNTLRVAKAAIPLCADKKK